MIQIAEHMHELAELGGDETRIAEWLRARGVQLAPDKQRTACQALLPGETECDGNLHYATLECRPGRAYPAPRRCGFVRYRSARESLAERLASCGYPVSAEVEAGDVENLLLAGIDTRREVAGLQDMVWVAMEACAAPLRANTALTGSCGTAKTQCLLAILFSALKQGHDAAFVTMAEVRSLAQSIDSYDPYAKASAQSKLAGLARRQLLVLDDVADRDAGRPTTEGVLLDILAGGAVTAFSSNLTNDKLKEHPDVGHRVVSRLYADREGQPVRGKYVHGPDQRQHGLRAALRLLDGGKK